MANESAKFMKNAYIGWTNTHGLYYPPDFEPGKLVPEKRYNREKFLKDKNKPKGPKTMGIRMMFPFSMICGTCGNFTYVATKFNSRVEKVQNEDYFGCAIYRFHGKCQHCCAAFTFKTDPASADYVMETGGSRSYECWKDADQAVDTVTKSKEEEAANDAMKALELASESAAAEMLINDALEGQQEINKRGKNPYEIITQALEFLYTKHEEGGSAEDLADPADFDDEVDEYRKEQMIRKRREMDEEIEEYDNSTGSSSAPSKKVKVEPGLADDEKTDVLRKAGSNSSRTCVPVKKKTPPSSIIIKMKMMPPPSVKIKAKKESDEQARSPQMGNPGEIAPATSQSVPEERAITQIAPEENGKTTPEVIADKKSIIPEKDPEEKAITPPTAATMEEPAAPLAFGAYDSDSGSD